MSLTDREGQPCLTIADSGPGIPEQERKNVFRRFYRLERSRRLPGNGLGLSLVEAVAKLHQVELTMEDNGPGLRATLAFKRVERQVQTPSRWTSEKTIR